MENTKAVALLTVLPARRQSGIILAKLGDELTRIIPQLFPGIYMHFSLVRIHALLKKTFVVCRLKLVVSIEKTNHAIIEKNIYVDIMSK